MNQLLDDINIIIKCFTRVKDVTKYYNSEISRLYSDLLHKENVKISLKKLKLLQKDYIKAIKSISKIRLSDDDYVFYLLINKDYDIDVRTLRAFDSLIECKVPSLKFMYNINTFELSIKILNFDYFDNTIKENKFYLNNEYSESNDSVKMLLEYYDTIKSRKKLLIELDLILKNLNSIKQIYTIHSS